MKTGPLNGTKSVEITHREKKKLPGKKKYKPSGHRRPPLTHHKNKNTVCSYSENVADQE